MKVIKIKIKPNDTKIYYSKKFFRNRVQAIKASIFHLESILKMYEGGE